MNIDIHTRMIRPDPKTGWSEAHCAVGKIEYGPEDYGYLLYVKASLTGDEPEDVLQYHSNHNEFPHQSTVDQWFDESQFESYRMLGLHIVDSVLATSFLNMNVADATSLKIGTLFEELFDAWYPPSEFIRESFTKHTTAFDALMERFRKDGATALLADFYPELKMRPKVETFNRNA